MAFQPLFRRSTRLPVKATLLTAGAISFATGTVHAEAPSEQYESQAFASRKKSIYDDEPLPPATPTSEPPSSSSSSSPISTAKSSISSLVSSVTPQRDSTASSSTSDKQSSSSEQTAARSTPTPTDRLAARVGRARVFLHAHAAAAEDRVNGAMTSFLDLENSFTSTVASLAPPKETGEKLMPGGIYVLVAAMTGSIVSRNRNILLRASVPVAFGIAAGWVVLPITMRNVGDLTWKYEKKVPVISNNHLRIKGFTMEAWKIAKERGGTAANAVDGKLKQGRETVEQWVRKG